MPDYITGVRDRQIAIEMWESEGGRSIHADIRWPRERERGEESPSDEAAGIRACPARVKFYRLIGPVSVFCSPIEREGVNTCEEQVFTLVIGARMI